MAEPIVVPPLVADTVRHALAERDRRQGLAGMTRTAALVATELAVAPVTTVDTVRQVAAWHQANPEATLDDGRSTLLGGVWGGRAGRDWALAMAARLAAPSFVDPVGERAAGPVAAGIAVVAADTGRVLLLQRCLDDKDPNGGKWEMPGGKLDDGEGAYEAAQREFCEEARIPVPGRLAGDWQSPDGVYHGFVHVVPAEVDVTLNVDHEDRHVSNPDDPDGDNVEVVAWWSIDDAEGNPVIRPEVLESTPWDDLRDVARARHASARLAAVQASGEWHNSDGLSLDATADVLRRHLLVDHINVHDVDPSLDRDGLDDLHARDHGANGEVGAHDEPGTVVAASGWDESRHHRAPKGTREGGRFVTLYRGLSEFGDANTTDGDAVLAEVEDQYGALGTWGDEATARFYGDAETGGAVVGVRFDEGDVTVTDEGVRTNAPGVVESVQVKTNDGWKPLPVTEREVATAPPATAAISDPLPILGRRDVDKPSLAKLRRASRRLAKVDRDLRAQLAAGADVAMADGLRRAGVKVTQRAAKRSKAVQASVGGCDGVYPAAVLAAAGITEQEALAHAFDAYADRAARWIDEAHRKRERILREELGADASLLARARQRWAQATARAVEVLTAGLTDLAIARLTKGHPHEPDGEAGTGPAPLVPGSLILQAVDAADGKDGRWAPGVTFEVIGESGIHVGVITDGRPLVERIVWRWNDSEHPFDPHLDLDGTEATADTYTQVWAKSPDVFPFGTTYWFAGDHFGCSCSWDTTYEVADGTVSPHGTDAATAAVRPEDAPAHHG